jgi:5-methylcytosine-specific restriction endonuclease McrA
MEDKKEIARIRATEWYRDNPEMAKEARRAWYLRNKEKMRTYNLEYRKVNHDKLLAYDKKRSVTKERIAQHKKWRDSHPETNRERSKKWATDNPERAANNLRCTLEKRRARLRNVPYEKINRKEVYLKDGMICGICGGHLEMSDFTIDHIIPISKGGGHVFGNVHSAHRICNIRRGTKPLEILYSL